MLFGHFYIAPDQVVVIFSHFPTYLSAQVRHQTNNESLMKSNIESKTFIRSAHIVTASATISFVHTKTLF